MGNVKDVSVGTVSAIVNKNEIQVVLLNTDQPITILVEDAKSFSEEELVTVNNKTNKLVDEMENYPFV